jgi:hypothetical protein
MPNAERHLPDPPLRAPSDQPREPRWDGKEDDEAQEEWDAEDDKPRSRCVVHRRVVRIAQAHHRCDVQHSEGGGAQNGGDRQVRPQAASSQGVTEPQRRRDSDASEAYSYLPSRPRQATVPMVREQDKQEERRGKECGKPSRFCAKKPAGPHERLPVSP